MKNNDELRDYWNNNLDPFNWKPIKETQITGVWKKAVLTYLSPEVVYALSCMGNLQGKRLLLLGCGLGQGCMRLAQMGAIVTGIDISPERIRIAKDLTSAHEPDKPINYRIGDAANMPFSDSSFDLVLSQDVLMYSQPSQVADECARILVKGGKAVFIESLKNNPLVAIFRKHTYDDATVHFTHHLSLTELTTLMPSDCRPISHKAFYLFSSASFGLLYLWRSVRLYRLALCITYPLDAIAFALSKPLHQYAWKGVAVYEKR